MPAKRKIIVRVAVSADGFIARRDGGVDWLDRPAPKGHYGMAAFYDSMDTILWGRKTYEVALAFQKQGVAGAEFDKSRRNYIFTRGNVPQDAQPGLEFTRQAVKPFARRLRRAKGKNIWIMGGAELIASFLDAEEVDEFILDVVPVFIGEGIPLIRPAKRTIELKLLSSSKFSDGVVQQRYAPAKRR